MLLYDATEIGTLLDRSGADGLLAATPTNVRYLTRFPKANGSLGLVLRESLTAPILIVPSPNLDFVLEEIGETTEVHVYGEFFRYLNSDQELNERENLIARLHETAHRDLKRDECAAWVLRQRGVASGTLLTDVEAGELAGLADQLPSLEVRSDPSAFRRLRMLKTEEEIRRLSEVARLTEEAIEAALEEVAEGVSQVQVARAFQLAVASKGARLRLDNVSFGRSAAFGNANSPEDQLAVGQVIRFDVGAIQDGYASDMARCYTFREAEEKVRRYHGALQAGQEAALASLRPGIEAGDLFEIAVQSVKRAGLPHYERTHIGHGIGLHGDGYDPPLLAPEDRTVLKAGMVLCVETPYYEIGFGGLQVEDMVLVTEGEPKRLTLSGRDLEILT